MRAALTCCVLVLCFGVVVRSAPIDIGYLSYDEVIPAGGPGAPGVNGITIANLTGAFSLPLDFPIETALTIHGAQVIIETDALTKTVSVGDIAPGFAGSDEL